MTYKKICFTGHDRVILFVENGWTFAQIQPPAGLFAGFKLKPTPDPPYDFIQL